MPYAKRRVLDCDAHIMEPAGWLASFAPAAVRDRLPPMHGGDAELAELVASSEKLRARRRRDAAEADAARVELLTMPRKGWGALGDHDPAERSLALDELGFDAQLVFPTGSFPQAVGAPDDIFEEAVRAMNRGLAAFCADDRRLLAVGYVPFRHGADVALTLLDAALADGCAAVMVDAVPPEHGQSHTHPSFDSVWSAIADADVAVMLHVGLDNGWRPIRPSFFDNGRALEHFRSDAPGDALSFLAIGYGAELFIGSMLFDGVLHRHPTLRFGVAELGATWVPGFLRFLDTAARSFRRMQDLSHLTEPPSACVREHFCFSPFAGEDVGWMIETSGPELFAFSSDFPHHEGTDDPIGRFERTMTTVSDGARDAFYVGNTQRLLGSRCP